jgi:hypothetical protein
LSKIKGFDAITQVYSDCLLLLKQGSFNRNTIWGQVASSEFFLGFYTGSKATYMAVPQRGFSRHSIKGSLDVFSGLTCAVVKIEKGVPRDSFLSLLARLYLRKLIAACLFLSSPLVLPTHTSI